MSGSNGAGKRVRKVGRVEMRRVTRATDPGDCWLCGRGRWWHRLFGWLLRHEYDPLRECSFAEFKRLDDKYREAS